MRPREGFQGCKSSGLILTFIKVPTDISGFFWLKRMPADSYEYRLSASLSSQIFFIYQSFSMRNGKSVEAIRQFFLDYGEIDFAFAITDDNRYLLIKCVQMDDVSIQRYFSSIRIDCIDFISYILS